MINNISIMLVVVVATMIIAVFVPVTDNINPK